MELITGHFVGRSAICFLLHSSNRQYHVLCPGLLLQSDGKRGICVLKILTWARMLTPIVFVNVSSHARGYIPDAQVASMYGDIHFPDSPLADLQHT